MVAVGLLLLMVPAAVLAHAELETSTPAADSMVDGPFTDPIVMTFSEALVGDSGARLQGDAGDVPATFVIDGDTMTLTPDSPLLEGDYQVQWTSVAADGDIERGNILFTVVAAATPEPTASPTPTPVATTSAPPSTAPSTAPTPAPTVTAAPSGPDEAATGGGSGDVLLPIIVGALLVLGLAVLLFRRRDTPPTTP